jgi:hypothetical protein
MEEVMPRHTKAKAIGGKTRRPNARLEPVSML